MTAGGHWRAHMIVYHGSNVAVPEPRLVAQNRFLDFGYGFYTTTNRAQAISFADKVTKRRGSGQRTVRRLRAGRRGGVFRVQPPAL